VNVLCIIDLPAGDRVRLGIVAAIVNSQRSNLSRDAHEYGTELQYTHPHDTNNTAISRSHNENQCIVLDRW
jgi:hypothetical protein